MKKACKAAAETLALKNCPLEAVTAAIAILEDAPLTNAGTGSNLTFDGFVECDASVMAGDGTFGSIAAAGGIRNPCAAAARLALDSREPLSHGRVRPVMLAGDAARVWALSQGLQASNTAEEAKQMHVTPRACQQQQKYLDILSESNVGIRDGSQGADSTSSQKRRRINGNHKSIDTDLLNDTVGCCVITARGQVASGVSSGGIALKTSGRVGEASLYGAGCWAQETENGSHGVAVSVTGVGERIMKHLVARECAMRVLVANNSNPGGSDISGGVKKRKTSDADDPLSICAKYIKETVGVGPPPRDCGVLCAFSSTQQQAGHLHVVLTAVHCEAESMAVAWLSEDASGKQRSEARILRKNNDDSDRVTSQSLVVGVHWPLP
jgi:taspase (threonine aspartase 1)